jgi:hypothetical protein
VFKSGSQGWQSLKFNESPKSGISQKTSKLNESYEGEIREDFNAKCFDKQSKGTLSGSLHTKNQKSSAPLINKESDIQKELEDLKDHDIDIGDPRSHAAKDANGMKLIQVLDTYDMDTDSDSGSIAVIKNRR